jgi:hypothetical protein
VLLSIVCVAGLVLYDAFDPVSRTVDGVPLSMVAACVCGSALAAIAMKPLCRVNASAVHARHRERETDARSSSCSSQRACPGKTKDGRLDSKEGQEVAEERAENKKVDVVVPPPLPMDEKNVSGEAEAESEAEAVKETEAEAVAAESGEEKQDPIASLCAQFDQERAENKTASFPAKRYIAQFSALLEENPAHAELLYRLARAHYNAGTVEAVEEEKLVLFNVGLTFAKQALAVRKSADTHKWVALLSMAIGNVSGPQKRLEYGMVFYENTKSALVFDPTDSELNHMQGR